jgi:hypothetical protein
MVSRWFFCFEKLSFNPWIIVRDICLYIYVVNPKSTMPFEPDIKTQDPTSLTVSSEASSKPYLSLCLSATVGNLGRNYGECA